MGSFVRLIVEVVSINWRDCYRYKLVDCEALSISEYWITDYLGLGTRCYIGNPKQPTFSVSQLIDCNYQATQFRGNYIVVSPTFQNFNITVQPIFFAAEMREKMRGLKIVSPGHPPQIS